jgi:serine/threonine protein kinase
MAQYQQVNKQLIKENHNVDQLLKNLEDQDKKATQPETKTIPEEKQEQKDNARWKQKFIRVWQEGEKKEKEEEEKKNFEGFEED